MNGDLSAHLSYKYTVAKLMELKASYINNLAVVDTTYNRLVTLTALLYNNHRESIKSPKLAGYTENIQYS